MAFPVTTAPARATCYRCLKPRFLCLCGRCRRVDNRTGIIILQHPREARHPFGTARIAALCLGNVRVEVANRAPDRSVRHEVHLPTETALLYPSPGATELSQLPPVARPRHLLLLDGTWSHAGRLLRDNPWLSSLLRVKITPAEPSRYRVRKEPKPHYLSTIESIALGLQVLEPETEGIEHLFAIFDAMISEHLATRIAVANGSSRCRVSRSHPWRRLSVPA